jgi:hypothetical protein
MGDELLDLLESQLAEAQARATLFSGIAATAGSGKDMWRARADEWRQCAQEWQKAITIRRSELGDKP